MGFGRFMVNQFADEGPRHHTRAAAVLWFLNLTTRGDDTALYKGSGRCMVDYFEDESLRHFSWGCGSFRVD